MIDLDVDLQVAPTMDGSTLTENINPVGMVGAADKAGHRVRRKRQDSVLVHQCACSTADNKHVKSMSAVADTRYILRAHQCRDQPAGVIHQEYPYTCSIGAPSTHI